MVDIQSLIWVSGRALQEKVVPAPRFKEVVDLLPEFTSEYLATDKGQENIESYAAANRH